MTRNLVFAEGEWYHCFNRGVEKRVVYQNKRDYSRFIELLYLANDVEPFHRATLNKRDAIDVFSMPRTQPLVSIGAYALMPNHYHLLLKPILPNGLSVFMQKLGTAYTMYFNTKYERVGNLFVKPFRARHVEADRYLQHVAHYIHLNPAELYEHGWKTGEVHDMRTLSSRLIEYPYSSLHTHQDRQSFGYQIIDDEIFDVLAPSNFSDMLQEARMYYFENSDLEK